MDRADTVDQIVGLEKEMFLAVNTDTLAAVRRMSPGLISTSAFSLHLGMRPHCRATCAICGTAVTKEST